MTITQEMVSVLFEKETIEKVQNQFATNKEIIPVESRDMSFRLFKSEFGNINLELLATDDYGMYFKVIGYYEKDVFDNIDITILNEFEDDYEELDLQTEDLNVLYMDIDESGVVSAFSRETINQVQKMYAEKEIGISEELAKSIGPFPHIHAMQFDKYFTANGLEVELLFSMDGFPQFFLDDKYNFEGSFGAYFKDENGLRLSPATKYSDYFNKFYKMGLLSAFNSI